MQDTYMGWGDSIFSNMQEYTFILVDTIRHKRMARIDVTTNKIGNGNGVCV